MTAAEDKAKKLVADAEAKAKKIVDDAQAKADKLQDDALKEVEERSRKLLADAEAKAAELKETSDETEEKSSVNDKFNALWAQINEEYEEDTLRQTVLAQLEALQFAAKGLDD